MILSEQTEQDAKAQYLYARALVKMGRTDDAIEAYRRALKFRPAHAATLLGLGHALKTNGQLADAVSTYRSCLALRPDSGEIYWSLANLKTYPLTAIDIEAMACAVAKNEHLSDSSRMHFYFALAKAREDTGEFDRAWQYYQRGNQLQRQQQRYDSRRTMARFDNVIETFGKPFPAYNPGRGNQSSTPIFIVGLPRSGSTLIEQILASHSQVEGTAELPYLGRVARSVNRKIPSEGLYRDLGQQYLDLAENHCHLNKPFFTDKNPNNFIHIGLLRQILPNAKIIDARRYPLDAALGCYRQLFARGQSFSSGLADIGNYSLQYHRVMDHWHEVLPGAVHTVQYEELVTNFEQQVRALLDYCGLPFERACMNFFETDRAVRTASCAQVRQPLHRNALHFWRNYQPQLGQLIEIMRPILPRYRSWETINVQQLTRH